MVVHFLQNWVLDVPWSLSALWGWCIDFINSINFQVSHIFCVGSEVVDILSKLAFLANVESWMPNLPSIFNFCSS